VRRLKRLPPNAALLMMDETVLRLFPPLRSAWALKGEQAKVPVSGHNARRTLSGVLNLLSGQRHCWKHLGQRQGNFQEVLRALPQAYPDQKICLVLDKNPAHTAKASLALAKALGIELIWLPTQWPELNAVDHLWRELKGKIAANRQYESVEEASNMAVKWFLGLNNQSALRKAGILSAKFWLKKVSQIFCPPT
jgi:transposase